MLDETVAISEASEKNRLIRRPYLDRLAGLQHQKNLEKRELEDRLHIKIQEGRQQLAAEELAEREAMEMIRKEEEKKWHQQQVQNHGVTLEKIAKEKFYIKNIKDLNRDELILLDKEVGDWMLERLLLRCGWYFGLPLILICFSLLGFGNNNFVVGGWLIYALSLLFGIGHLFPTDGPDFRMHLPLTTREYFNTRTEWLEQNGLYVTTKSDENHPVAIQ